MTTVQDLGRRGYQHLGVPPSGALDHVGLRAANLLVGNPAQTAALEIAYAGPTLAVEAESARVALAGPAAIEILSADEEGPPERLAPYSSARLVRGQRLSIGALRGSAVAYLAVEGGFALPPVMGSLSTLTRAAIGGYEGRALRAGDIIALAQNHAEERPELMLPAPSLAPCGSIRVVLGPQADHFTRAGVATLLSAGYRVSEACDRMGMRLSGPALEHSERGSDIVSDGIATGAIQVPGDGQPIVLLADRQTTGGYPKIATVISADIPGLARLMPGQRVAFKAVAIEEAEAAAQALATFIADLPLKVTAVQRARTLDAARLMGENLVSGIIDAREASGVEGQ